MKEIYEENVFSHNSFEGRWLPDGSGYLLIEKQPEGDTEQLVSYVVSSGHRKLLISNVNFDKSDYSGPFTIEDYIFSPDGDKVLVQMTDGDKNKPASDYWLLDRSTGAIEKDVAGVNSRISPDGKQILYTKQGDLYVYHLINKKITQLTFDANSEAVSNRRADWNPDGKNIVFVQINAKEVRKRAFLIPGDPSYPVNVNAEKYPLY